MANNSTDSAERTSTLRPRTVLVVGGGPAGLVTLRNLVGRSKGQFDRVLLVERRDDVGGIWYQDEPIIPSANPTTAMNKPQWPSPAYPGLIGNVLPRFLAFSESPFPETREHPHQPFPTLAETYEYLRAFAEPYIEQGIIQLNTEVMRIEEMPEKKGWKVRTRDWSMCDDNDGMPLQTEEIWDAVAVCAGYYDKPNWPDTEGLDMVRKRGLALHAKWWNGPDGYEGKKAVIIGNANSSNDIATQLAPVAQPPVYRSMRRPPASWFPTLPDPRIQNVGAITKYVLQPAEETDEGMNLEKVTVILQDGSEIKDVDVVILGTGYCPHPEFVHILPIPVDDTAKVSIPANAPETKFNNKPVSSTVSLMSYTTPILPQFRRIPFLHRHMLYSYNPSLAFIGAILAMTPFIVADVASTWLTLAWLGEVSYPDSVDERLAFDRERIAQVVKMLDAPLAGGPVADRNGSTQNSTESSAQLDPPSSFVTYSFLGPGDSENGGKGGEAEYANDLRDDIVRARPDLNAVLPTWDEEAIKSRTEMYPTKYEALKWAQIHCV
ncbi:hypothetical protein J3R30DRAFT_3700333 [Lentinula aciculospora]|uniref:FAD/NAD(P)-binding domain-containing protein n=1 Tax=Lentinula aciculospora TaxID=153920 RepID=A0A9W9DQQ2_9AGAR|nr:hypothetical protein J3R30DRAFT_3700333 [Lentinula aciculospora]